MKFNNKKLRESVEEWLVDEKLAELKYGHISEWDVSNVTNMSNLFSRCSEFNEDLSKWETTKVKNFSGMFQRAKLFNQNINCWDVSNATKMVNMFEGAISFNQPLNKWNVSNVKSMEYMFSAAESFNQDIRNWNVSNVTNMKGLFHGAESFNQDIRNWNVANVTNMWVMFGGAISFNQPLNKWDVSKVKTMQAMFSGAESFNYPLNNWDTSNVFNMHWMFNDAKSFNQDISNWDKRKVIYKMDDPLDEALFLFNLEINKLRQISDPLTQSKPVEVNEIESNIDGEIWIAMEKSEFLDIDDKTFEALELTIQFSDEGDGEHEIIETIKNEMNFENLVFTEYQDDNGEFKLQKVINCPEIQDTDNYGDAGHHGPFSTTEEVVDYLKKLKTINFDELDLYTDSMD